VDQFVAQFVSAAVVGAVSPIATMATIAVLSGRHRPLLHAVCVLVGWTIVLVVLAALMRALLGGDGQALSDDTKAVLNVVIGVLLLSFGLRNVLGARHPLHDVLVKEREAAHVPGWMQALDRLTPLKALGIGGLLLLISPADLAVYLSALQGLQDVSSGKLVLNVLLIAAIDLCILIPVGVYVLMPHRAAHILEVARVWLLRRQRQLAAWTMLVFGALLLLSGALDLA
jgi:hypothetical protein